MLDVGTELLGGPAVTHERIALGLRPHRHRAQVGAELVDPGARAEIEVLGVHMLASDMALGAAFENVLKRGLLEFALRLPYDAPAGRVRP